MRDDEEILRTYEAELAAEPVPVRRSNRGFWMVIGTITLAGVILVGEILANKPIGDAIGTAQHSLRVARAAAGRVRTETGSFAGADAADLAMRERSLTYRGPGDPSRSTTDVSVLATDATWAAAVQVRPGACFYLRAAPDGTDLFGSGEVCTGQAALAAQQPQW